MPCDPPIYLPTTATVFSWAIDISGLQNFDFGGIRFSFGVNGLGASGVSSVQLEFDLYDGTETLASFLTEQAEVKVRCPELSFVSQTFFLSRRTVSKKVCHCVCYDRMCKTDRHFENVFADGGDGTEKIPANSVLSEICRQCGFNGFGASGYGLESVLIKRSDLENVTCRSLLEDVSEAAVGVFVCGADGSLYLACLGGGEYGGAVWAEEYTEIDYQGGTTVTALTMTNSDTGEEYSFGGAETTGGAALEIESPFVTRELAVTVWERVGNYVYKAWHCDKADVTYGNFFDRMGAVIFMRGNVPADGGSLLVGGLFATATEFSCDCTGIYFSGGAAPYDDWNYRSYLERRKLGIGKNVGNTSVAANGDIIFRNLNKGGGLNECDNGISICVRNKNQ